VDLCRWCHCARTYQVRARQRFHLAWKFRVAKIDGTHLPFEDRSIDLSFTVTVPQHVTDAAMLEALVKDICRVTRDTVVIMEDIGQCERLGAKARASIARLAPTRA
jgi:hypothetical protein